MDRARSLPLSFGLRVFKVKSKFATKAILRLFINSVHRCRDVTLVLASLSPNLIDMENLSLQHPYLLQNATIEFADKPNAKFDFLFNHIFSAPNLRSAKFFCEHQISLDKVAPSWSNLQELTVDVFSPALLISALAFCRNLKQLTISDTRTAGRIPIRPITLPQLTHLSVSMGVCPSFFDNLLVPSLKEVHIQNVEGKSWGHLIRLLERSAVMIKVLTLEWSRWRSEEPDIMQSLGTSVFREMRVLYVKYPVGMKIVEFLTLPSRSNWESGMREHDCGSNLPHLQKLELFLYKPDPEDVFVTLSRLVESRLGTSDPEIMRRCVHWGGMRAEVKLSMDGPSELVHINFDSDGLFDLI